MADGSLEVADQRAGGDGTDVLINIETLVFANVTKSYADVVNQAPVGIAVSATSIPETAVGGTLVGLLSATDPNGAGDIAGFTLVGGGASPFEIVGNELRLKAGAALDFETASAYPVTVRVTDRSGATLDRPFTIGVTNVNEAPTGVTVTGGEISEDAAPGTVAAQLAAIDPDHGDTHSFALAAGYDGPFEIVGDEIRLRVGATLDSETAGTVSVPVVVTDAGGLLLSTSVTIHVGDANDRPTGLDVVGGVVAEDLSGGGLVAVLAGHDPDVGDTLQYALPANYDGPFEIAGNEIRLKAGAHLDFEASATHVLDVLVTDSGGLSLSVPILVSVTNVNEAPAGVIVDGGEISESAMPGAVAARLTGVDPDAGDTTSIAVDPDYAGPFELVGDELRLKAGAVLDRELVTAYAVPILVTDAGGLTSGTSVTITVTDVNEAPDGLEVSGGVVAEGLGGGSVVALLTGHDPDAGDSLTYALPTSYAGPFEIAGNEIRLKAGASLDHEAAGQHVLTVTTSDAGGLSRSDVVTITVTNVNEAPTSLGVTGGTVAENAVAGTVVARLAGTDPDAGDSLTYALPASYAGPFEIVGDEIRIKAGASLDYETQPSYSLQVTVRDAGGLAITSTVLVTITDVPEGSGATAGPDVLYGTSAADIIDGLAGNDWISGGGGNDRLSGSAGADTIFGNDGSDVIDGGSGADTLTGGAGADTIEGDSGDDTIASGEGADILLGGGGDDAIDGGSGADEAWGGVGDDAIAGQAGDDVLFGNEGDDLIQGGAGADLLYGGEGADRLFGDAGADTLLGGIGDDFLIGAAGDDWLRGEAGDDRIEGGAGADRIEGGAGSDRLIGGGGNDTILTGAGADTIVFTRNSGDEIVTDFENNVDTLEIAGVAFGALSIAAVSGGTMISVGGSSVMLTGIAVRDVYDDIMLV